MTSESLFTKCKNCGKDISKSVRACPGCGKKQKKLGIIHWVGIAFVGLIVVGMIGSPENGSEAKDHSASTATSSKDTKSRNSLKPEGQIQFSDAVSISSRNYEDAKNELQQSSIRDKRKEDISSILRSYTINSWVGTINQLETNTDGKAILSVRIAPNIEIKTWNNALSDIASNTLIEKGTGLYKDLFNLSNGQRVIFSGSFFPSEADHIEETSITIDGSMRNPEFLFKFNSVKPIE